MVVTRSRTSAAGSAKPQEIFIIPYLPPEVHRIIAQYIHSADLPSYRLASKICASIGTKELFSSLAFHCSSASTARIDAIKACEHLNKYVDSLVWDANFWSIPNVRDLHEWREYFKGKAFATSKPMIVGDNFGTTELLQLAHNRDAWVDYVYRVKDEKIVKRGHNMQQVLLGFHNLRKLHILNGGLGRRHRGIGKCSDFVTLPPPPASHYRGESLYNDGATIARLQRPGTFPFNILQELTNISPQLTKLRLDSVCCSAFSRKVSISPAMENLTSFHIRLSIRFEHHWGDSRTIDTSSHAQAIRDHVREARRTLDQQDFTSFLHKLTKLESLKVEFDGPIYDEHGRAQSPMTVRDLIYDDHIWPHLRKLKLRQLDTTSAALLSLLKSQSSTLRVLRLHEIWILPDYQMAPLNHDAFTILPSYVLKRLGEVLHLEEVKLSGYFGPGPTFKDEWWNFTKPSLANAVEVYMVQGGSFPVNTTYGQ